ncbi:MAG: DUF4136 domain-containing protein [Gemmatimonadota bacterium]|nr:MAG: DUF4136 domain-containing protein [Gemmatimonadota bacterium]
MKVGFRIALVPVLVGFVLAGCSSIKYNYDFDPQGGFAGYETYGWAQTTPEIGPNPRGVSDLIERRIMGNIDEELAVKGYRKIDSGSPDFVLNFMLTTAERTDYHTYYSGWGYAGGWYGRGGVGMGTSQTTAYTYTDGTLIVDIFDAGSRNLVWRGSATGTIEPDMSPEKRNKRIAEVVANILEKFPPQS